MIVGLVYKGMTFVSRANKFGKEKMSLDSEAFAEKRRKTELDAKRGNDFRCENGIKLMCQLNDRDMRSY